MSGSNNPGSPQSLSQSVNLHHKVAAAAVSWEFSLPFSCLVARTGLTSLPFCELVTYGNGISTTGRFGRKSFAQVAGWY